MQVRFFFKHGLERTPTRQLSQAAAPLTISSPEATVFDLIRYAGRIGGIGRAAETIFPLLPVLEARPLRRLLEAEEQPAVAQRLGFILEAGGAARLAKVIHDWLPATVAVVPLAPLRGQTNGFPLIERWKILNNSGELK